jgi:hypothetical protein
MPGTHLGRPAEPIYGMPVCPPALLLVYAIALMGVITPYATGPAPVYFASGFKAATGVTLSDCCRQFVVYS